MTGPATTDVPRGTDAIAKRQARLGAPGRRTIFRQSAWTAAKDQALATLDASPYAAAKIAHSEAFIDPAHYSGDADASSSPAARPFRFGRS